MHSFQLPTEGNTMETLLDVEASALSFNRVVQGQNLKNWIITIAAARTDSQNPYVFQSKTDLHRDVRNTLQMYNAGLPPQHQPNWNNLQSAVFEETGDAALNGAADTAEQGAGGEPEDAEVPGKMINYCINV